MEQRNPQSQGTQKQESPSLTNSTPPSDSSLSSHKSQVPKDPTEVEKYRKEIIDWEKRINQNFKSVFDIPSVLQTPLSFTTIKPQNEYALLVPVCGLFALMVYGLHSRRFSSTVMRENWTKKRIFTSVLGTTVIIGLGATFQSIFKELIQLKQEI